MGKNIHVVTYGELWAVKRNGKALTSRSAPHNTQEQAVVAGRAIARADQVEFELHGRDGRIREKDSYGNDPRDVPG